MRVASILSTKGATVATIAPEARVTDAAAELRLRGVGALVVSSDGRHILGILSERDVVRRLAERGEAALGETVAEVMTDEVRTCSPEDSCEDLARSMTDHRHRHMPVTVEGQLVGIVSIGDIVKARLTELEDEARQLHDYIVTGR
jgi:CBS domain-containing protein